MKPKLARQIKYQNLFKEEIQERAMELILDKGITNVTFADIAQAVGTSRVTLYKHYNSIHEIIFDIQLNIMSQITDQNLRNTSPYNTGAENLQIFLENFSGLFKEKADMIRFTAIFDHTYRSSYPSRELQDKYSSFITETKKAIDRMIREGIEDGSLRRTGDIELLSDTLLQSILGLMQRLATRKRVVPGDPKEEDLRVLENFTSLILSAMKSE